MGCGTRKCANAQCNTHMKQCQMIMGKCPPCHQKEQEQIRNQQNANNTTQINQQYINQ